MVALGHLADASAARDRLATSADAEALHDFRVALRRLRSWERAFRPYVRNDLPKKLRRRLRDLARDTGMSRDLEVHIEWLREQRRTLPRRLRADATWLLAELDRRRADADAVLEQDIDARFARLKRKLGRALRSYREELILRDDGQPTWPAPFASALAPRVRDAAAELRTKLDRIEALSNQAEAHDARISAKRLRYLMEPVVKGVPGAAEVVEQLKGLQDTLGDLHDAQVFGSEIEQIGNRESGVGAADDGPKTGDEGRGTGDEAPTKGNGGSEGEPRDVAPASPPVGASTTASATQDASEARGASTGSEDRDAQEHGQDVRPSPQGPPGNEGGAIPATDVESTPSPAGSEPRPGVAAIQERLRERAKAAFASVTEQWLGDRSTKFFAEAETVAARIEDAVRVGVEIERKYLLRFLPDRAREGVRLDIAQGYLPGEQLHERVRRVSISRGRGKADVRFYRTVKLGDGVARTEIEEETTREIFETLWPLTKGRRIRKRRYRVEAGNRTWELDEFLNRDLVLAEIELEAENEKVRFPKWLARAVRRDVTTEPEYQNINLAR